MKTQVGLRLRKETLRHLQAEQLTQHQGGNLIVSLFVLAGAVVVGSIASAVQCGVLTRSCRCSGGAQSCACGNSISGCATACTGTCPTGNTCTCP